MKYLAGILVIINTLLSIDKLMAQPPSTPGFKQEFLDIINRTRAKGCTCGTKRMAPTGPLIWNDQLAVAAMGHAKDMANQNYFSHMSEDGRTMNDRISAAGYTFSGYRSYMIGENIAQGQMSIKEVMNGWFKSPGHCMNLMNPNFKEIGIAEYDTYWVQDFGGRDPFTPEQQKLIKSGKMKVIERN